MRRTRGQTIILVLIMLGVGALIIIPTLRFADTGLIHFRISRDTMRDQYTTDAAVEDAIYRLRNNVPIPGDSVGLVDRLTPGGSAQTYTRTVNNVAVPVTVAFPAPPSSAEPAPPRQPGLHVHTTLDRSPKAVKVGNTLQYILTATNYGTSVAFVREIRVWLPAGFNYVRTLSGMVIADPTITTEPDGAKLLIWDVPGVGYRLRAQPTPESGTLVFEATPSSAEAGIHYAQARVRSGSGQQENLGDPTGPIAPVWVNIYHIMSKAERLEVHTSVALTQSGNAELLSWQFQ